jgi:hypothetical protein
MNQFRVDTLIGNKNSNCVACSSLILEEFKKEGAAFIRHLSDHPEALQSLSGITSILDGVLDISLDAFEDDC